MLRLVSPRQWKQQLTFRSSNMSELLACLISFSVSPSLSLSPSHSFNNSLTLPTHSLPACPTSLIISPIHPLTMPLPFPCPECEISSGGLPHSAPPFKALSRGSLPHLYTYSCLSSLFSNSLNHPPMCHKDTAPRIVVIIKRTHVHPPFATHIAAKTAPHPILLLPHCLY
eukprot:m.197044 g.197044  ORF g.197044 m.197044 type:complete len:170 (-) comp15471_c2_seq11:19-528(-)